MSKNRVSDRRCWRSGDRIGHGRGWCLNKVCSKSSEPTIAGWRRRTIIKNTRGSEPWARVHCICWISPNKVVLVRIKKKLSTNIGQRQNQKCSFSFTLGVLLAHHSHSGHAFIEWVLCLRGKRRRREAVWTWHGRLLPSFCGPTFLSSIGLYFGVNFYI